MKRKPSEGGSNSRKRGSNSNQSQGGSNLPNGLGGDHDHRDLTIQEYYESEEILKVCRGLDEVFSDVFRVARVNLFPCILKNRLLYLLHMLFEYLSSVG